MTIPSKLNYSITINPERDSKKPSETQGVTYQARTYIKEHPWRAAAIGAVALAAIAAGAYGLISRGVFTGISSYFQRNATVTQPQEVKDVPPTDFSQAPTNITPPSKPVPSAYSNQASLKAFPSSNPTLPTTETKCKTAEYAAEQRKKGAENLKAAGRTIEELDSELASLGLKAPTVNELKERFGKDTLSMYAVRDLYNELDQSLPQELLLNKPISCEAKAKLYADCRSVIRDYARERSYPKTREETHQRNLCQYGTEPDFLYLRATKDCSAIMQSAQKTNVWYNLGAEFLKRAVQWY